jgi:heptose I phosphotransferase
VELWRDRDPFAELWAMPGRDFRTMRGRRTFRFELDGMAYFAKLHSGVGWKHILGQWLRLRRPVVGAATERNAIRRLEQLGVATMKVAAFGEDGLSPASRRSFIVTKAIEPSISLEDFCAGWPQWPPERQLKWRLIREVARIAGHLHQGGVNHRDFYLCHFLLDSECLARSGEIRLSLIDLHRAQLRARAPARWCIKDISGLWFSALGIGLSRTDLLRFVREYEQERPARVLRNKRAFWNSIYRKMQHVRVREARKRAAGIKR